MQRPTRITLALPAIALFVFTLAAAAGPRRLSSCDTWVRSEVVGGAIVYQFSCQGLCVEVPGPCQFVDFNDNGVMCSQCSCASEQPAFFSCLATVRGLGGPNVTWTCSSGPACPQACQALPAGVYAASTRLCSCP